MSYALSRSCSPTYAALIPTTGTSIENGATTPAGYRDISQVHRPDPRTVAITMVYASPSSAGSAEGVNAVARESATRAGPSKASERANIGSGGTAAAYA